MEGWQALPPTLDPPTNFHRQIGIERGALKFLGQGFR
jgi:hypothetical protein